MPAITLIRYTLPSVWFRGQEAVIPYLPDPTDHTSEPTHPHQPTPIPVHTCSPTVASCMALDKSDPPDPPPHTIIPAVQLLPPAWPWGRRLPAAQPAPSHRWAVVQPGTGAPAGGGEEHQAAAQPAPSHRWAVVRPGTGAPAGGGGRSIRQLRNQHPHTAGQQYGLGQERLQLGREEERPLERATYLCWPPCHTNHTNHTPVTWPPPAGCAGPQSLWRPP